MKKIFSLLLLITIFFSSTLPVLAQTTDPKTGLRGHPCTIAPPGSGQERVVTLDCLPILFGNIIYWTLVFAGVVAVFLLIFGGIKLLVSGGDPKQVEGARKTVTWAIIGLIIIILSFAIVAIIAQITGVGCITNFGFTQCL